MSTQAVKPHTFGTSHYAVTSDGRKLHYMEAGKGECTVVFESGMGISRSTWGLVQPEVAKQVRAVVYDRAGTGKSDVDTAPRTLRRMAEDLHALLQALGSGPYILVGHSWGGAIVRVAAAMKPSLIKGIVLVDPSDEHCSLYFKPSAAKLYKLNNFLIPLLAKLRLSRMIGGKAGTVQPPDVVADHHKEDFTVQAAYTAVAEMTPMIEELKGLRDNPPQLGELEVSLISGTLLTRSNKSIRSVLTAAHQQSAAGWTNGRFVPAPESDHMVMYTEPEIIIQEILLLLPLKKI